MKRPGKTTLVVGIVFLAALGGAAFYFLAPSTPDLFEDKTPGSGIDFTYRNGEEADQFTILESLGGGVALIDFDRDGLLDVFVTGGGKFSPTKEIVGLPNRLFRNEGNWRFRDVTAEVGLPTEGAFYSHGCAVGDFDNDGWPDLLVTGYGRMALYRNDKGKFEDRTAAAKLTDKRTPHWDTSAAWADLDGDGLLDLFVCHYVDWSFANHPHCPARTPGHDRDVCGPDKLKPLLPALYLNQGDGTFREITAEAEMKPGNGLGVVVFDADNDGKLDVYVANDGKGNYLYLNKGQGKFEEAGKLRGVAFNPQGNGNGSMGIAAGDYDRTGFASLFVTNFQGQDHALYRNLGNGFFQASEHRAGLGSSLDRSLVGFGAGFADFDLDGSEDLLFANGHVLRFPEAPSTFKQRPVLLRNQFQPGDKGPTKFQIVAQRGGPYFRTDHMGRGVAFGDLDNDGGIDLVISHSNEPVVLLRNQHPKRGHWLGVGLVGKKGLDPIGAKLTLEAGGKKLTRFILGGGSYLSSSDRRIVFGLGSDTAIDKLTVQWPSGHSQTWSGSALQIDSYCELTEEATEVKRK